MPANHWSVRHSFLLRSARSGDGLTGNVIGPNDLMIAAIAQANNLTLVTHNTAEFGRIASLRIEDWQA